MSARQLHDDLDNLFVAPFVEFEITNAERELIEAALLHLQNDFESLREDEQGDIASVVVYRKKMIDELLSKFESIHELRHKNKS